LGLMGCIGEQIKGDPDDVIDKTGSYATSVTSSVQEYRYELGRRYHSYKAGSKHLFPSLPPTPPANPPPFPVYNFPNDEQEIKRLDFQNEIFKVLFDGKIYFAPIEDPKNILDLGTGTGTWAIEMGG
jgi:hypothetical protein